MREGREEREGEREREREKNSLELASGMENGRSWRGRWERMRKKNKGER